MQKEMAIDAGCHIFVEKPLALDSKDAEVLIHFAERKNCKLTIGYTYYFDPIMRALRELVNGWVLGEIMHLESFLGYDLNGPYGKTVMEDDKHWVRRLPGGLLHNVIDHLLIRAIEFMLLECVFPQAGKDAPDNVAVMIGLCHLNSRARIMTEVVWGHPSGHPEVEFRDNSLTNSDWPVSNTIWASLFLAGLFLP